jgi:DnaK suppressor protein
MEELSETEIEELVQDLKALRSEIEQSVEAARTGGKPVDLGLPIGRISRMDAIQQQMMSQAGAKALEVRMHQITAALSAADAGTYGYCRKCEEPIGYKRLKARPETPFCLECQASLERKR